MEQSALVKALTGALPLALLVAALLAPVFAIVLLWWYRRAVVAGMRKVAHASGPPELPAERGKIPPPLGQIDFIEVKPAAGLGAAGTAVKRLWVDVLLYSVAGLSAATVVAMAYVRAARADMPLKAIALFTVLSAWPVVLCLHLLLPPSRRLRAGLVVAYLALAGLALTFSNFKQGWTDRFTAISFTAAENAVFTVLMVVLLSRRVRAVGLMVFLLLLACMAGAQAVILVLQGDEKLIRAVARAGGSVGLGAGSTLLTALLLGAALFGVAGWIMLRVIGRLYECRAVSDLSMLTDSIWLAYGGMSAIILVFNGLEWLLTSVAAFGVYRLVLAMGRLVAGRSSAASPRGVIELRVFALGEKSAELFTAFATYWRQLGPVRLIAGPDLASTTVEPHEFLSFLSRKTASLFVEDIGTFDVTFKEDVRPDPDGRFRVQEFFCRDNTWKPVLRRLLHSGDPVLMDLRGFSSAHGGCEYELGALMDLAPFERVVLVVNGETNMPHLRMVLTEAWKRSIASSPNRHGGVCPVRLYRVDEVDLRTMRGLVAAVAAGSRS